MRYIDLCFSLAEQNFPRVASICSTHHLPTTTNNDLSSFGSGTIFLFVCFSYFSDLKVKDLIKFIHFLYWLVGKLLISYCSVAGTGPMRSLGQREGGMKCHSCEDSSGHEVTFGWLLWAWNHSDDCKNYWKDEWNRFSYCFLFISGCVMKG